MVSCYNPLVQVNWKISILDTCLKYVGGDTLWSADGETRSLTPCPAFITPCLTQPRRDTGRIVNQIALSAPSNDFIHFNTIQRLKFLWLLGTFMTMTCQLTGFHNEFFKHSIIKLGVIARGCLLGFCQDLLIIWFHIAQPGEMQRK